jgi:uncharacterized membrane protein YbaN (DUF454 family)
MLKSFVAYILLAVGVAGICLPVLPGIPFLLVGLRLLGPDHPLTRPLVSYLKKRQS